MPLIEDYGSNLIFLSFYNFYKYFSLLSNMFVYFPLSSICFFNVNEWRYDHSLSKAEMNKILTSNKSMQLNLYDIMYVYTCLYIC